MQLSETNDSKQITDLGVIRLSNGSINLEKYGVVSIANALRNNPNIEINFDIGFAPNSIVLNANGRSDVGKIARAIILMGTDYEFEIGGHTDGSSNRKSERKLSENRARVVATLLKNNHRVANSIATAGYGGTRPVSSNKSINERITIINRGAPSW